MSTNKKIALGLIVVGGGIFLLSKDEKKITAGQLLAGDDMNNKDLGKLLAIGGVVLFAIETFRNK